MTLVKVYQRAARSCRGMQSSDITAGEETIDINEIIEKERPALLAYHPIEISPPRTNWLPPSCRTFKVGNEYVKFPRDRDQLLPLDQEWATLFMMDPASLTSVGKKYFCFFQKEVAAQTLAKEEGLSREDQFQIGRGVGDFIVGMAKRFSGMEKAYPVFSKETTKLDYLPVISRHKIGVASNLVDTFIDEQYRAGCKAALNDYADRAEDSPVVLCHADFHRSNILVRDKRFASAIDYGEVRWDNLERAFYYSHGSYELREGKYAALMENQDPFVTPTMKRNVAAYRLYADLFSEHAETWQINASAAMLQKTEKVFTGHRPQPNAQKGNLYVLSP